jgi:cation transport regulator ChaB
MRHGTASVPSMLQKLSRLYSSSARADAAVQQQRRGDQAAEPTGAERVAWSSLAPRGHAGADQGPLEIATVREGVRPERRSSDAATTLSAPSRRVPASLQDAFAAIASALQLRTDAFAGLGAGATPEGAGLWIALAAGFSQAIGQAFILFVNRVRPLRFALSLLLEALLFAVGFLFWAVSTWLVARLGFGLAVPLPLLIRALGIAHAPQLLAFAGALPYLGAPWLRLLSLWTALAFEVGETECNLPRSPGMVYGWEAFPIIYLAREMLGRKDSR